MPHETKAALKAAREVRISPGQVLQREGENAARLWLLITGRVAVYRLARNGDKLFLRWGAPGDTFGLTTALKPTTRYLFTIEAVQDGSILAWDSASCQTLVSRFPNLSTAVSLVLANYLADVIDVLSMCQLQNVEQRLARVLIECARQLGHTAPEGIQVDLTNEELALAAHMSVFTATRNLSKWQDLGILKKYRGKIVLRSLSPFENFTK